MRRKLIFGFAVFSLLVIASYACLSAYASRLLKPSQFARFATVIAESAAHPGQGGALRALGLYRQAIVSEAGEASIDLDGRKYLFPLPKYAVVQPENSNGVFFVAFVSPDEMDNYFYQELPRAGWTQEQQLGAGHFLSGHGVHMTVVQHFYLTSGISEFHVSLDR
jgi:hypothetical protein